MRLKILGNIKDFFVFTFFDPRDFPTNKLQLKAMTSQFKKHFNAAFIYGQT